MPRIKLTKAQQAILDAINQGATARYMPYNRRWQPVPYWYLVSPRYQRCTKQVNRLIALGLVQVIVTNTSGGHKRVVVALENAPT